MYCYHIVKPLSILSRVVINKNVKREDIDSLPLPQILKDQCFLNIYTDRTNSYVGTKCLYTCKCALFSTKSFDFNNQEIKIPQWSKEINTLCDVNKMYLFTLPGLATDADWLALPERKDLFQLYLNSWDKDRKRMLEACLNPLRFDSTTGLGQIHIWLHRYLYYFKYHKWYHICFFASCTKRFLEEMKNVDLVILPYGCIQFQIYKDEKVSLENHHRKIIVVVKKDEDKKFHEAIKRLTLEPSTKQLYYCESIESVKRFIRMVNFVSWDHRHRITFNPLINHAEEWMRLLVPGGHLIRNPLDRRHLCYSISGQVMKRTLMFRHIQRIYTSEDVRFQNCVIRFDPLHQCIGDKIQDMEKHIEKNYPFVYWMGNEALNVKEIKPPCDKDFIQWCVSREMNTLQNLNGITSVDVAYYDYETIYDDV